MERGREGGKRERERSAYHSSLRWIVLGVGLSEARERERERKREGEWAWEREVGHTRTNTHRERDTTCAWLLCWVVRGVSPPGSARWVRDLEGEGEGEGRGRGREGEGARVWKVWVAVCRKGYVVLWI
jgi:hypothetical protein